jgi:NAD(P)H-dependent flavin oxidoreductase YrpB (nitropropane dioxygenase family)
VVQATLLVGDHAAAHSCEHLPGVGASLALHRQQHRSDVRRVEQELAGPVGERDVAVREPRLDEVAQLLGPRPQPQKHLLHEILGRGRMRDATQPRAHGRCATGEQFVERPRVASLHRPHQVAVAAVRLGHQSVGHRRRR